MQSFFSRKQLKIIISYSIKKGVFCMKKSLIFLFVFFLCFITALPVFAESTDSYTKTINAYIDSINQHDVPKLVSLFPADQQELLTLVYNNEENIQNKTGYLNIKTATLVSLQELSLDSYAPFTSLEKYSVLYGDTLKVYLVGKDCTVFGEDKYNYNGINYSILLLAKEGNNIVIVEDAAVPLLLFDQLLQSKNTNNVQDFQQARNIAYARTLGAITNNEGTILEVNNSEPNCNIANYIGKNFANYPFPIDNDYPHVRPQTIKVLLTNGTIKTVAFNIYCKNVLPNEWYSTWPEESLKAGALCVKMVAWYRVENPKYNGYDITATDSDQTYVEDSHTIETSTAYNKLANLSMHIKIEQGGYLFYPAYLAGTPGQTGTSGSGTVLQYGTKKLADDGYDYKSILKYYYDGSSRTYGNNISFYYTI